MSDESLNQDWARAYQQVAEGKMEEAAETLGSIVERDPTAGEGWINLATAERALGRDHLAAEHYEKGIALLEKMAPEDKGLLASALHALAGTYEELELTGKAIAAYRASAKNDPRAPTPFASLATLLARAGLLEEAGKVATQYCLAAVSILAEKTNIGFVRRFQKALGQASTIDGNLLLVATREAYARGFEQTAKKLPTTARYEVEPQRRDEAGELVPVLANPNRPWSRVRFDAVDPDSGGRWMIQETPTYGFPGNSPAAADGLFSVPYKVEVPFPVLIATRTAWDYFYVRLRFEQGLKPTTIERAEALIGPWYLRGFEGEFGEKDQNRGYFHFLAEPFAIGDYGLRYEVDLGLSQLDAVPALFDVLAKLHESDPIAVCVIGDGALPP